MAQIQNLPIILTLCASQAIHVSMLVHVHPLMVAYLLSLGVEQERVGTYSDLAEAFYSLTMFMFTPLWVSLAERYSKKILLVFSLFTGGTVAMTFGFCSHVWQVLLVRISLGGIQSLGLLAHVLMGDIVDANGRPQAFGWLGTSVFLGAMVGSALGGELALPEGRIPLLGDLPVFQTHSFALPGVVLGLIAYILASIAMLTLPREPVVSLRDAEDSSQLLCDEDQPITYKALLKNKPFLQLMLMEFLSKFNFFGTLALLSAAGTLPSSIGGLAMSVSMLGKVIASTDLSTILTLSLIFPQLSKHLTSRTLVIVASFGWILLAIFFPSANSLAQATDHLCGKKLLVLGLWIAGRCLGVLYWPAGQILLITIYPNKRERTKASAVLGNSASLASFLGASIFGHIFAVASHQKLGSAKTMLPFFLNGLIALSCVVAAMFQTQVRAIESGHNPDQVEWNGPSEETPLLDG